MRWPLRTQILLPMLLVTLVAVVGVSLVNAGLSAQRARERIENELAEIAQTLENAEFRLTDSVLRQMRGLSGAEFVLTDLESTSILSTSTPDPFPARPPGLGKSNTIETSSAAASLGAGSAPLTLAGPIAIGNRSYFHSSITIHQRNLADQGPRKLHIYYPQERYEEAWRDVVQPPLVVGALTMVLVVAVSIGIASRVTRPLVRLQGQVEGIAAGQFRSLPVPQRNDEVADLSRAVNRMAETLAHYEKEVRRNEQLRTLGQLGGGIAHQIRNSVTGCRMAIELHARACAAQSSDANDESLAVARRQLELMETYLRRFLALGRTDAAPFQRIILQASVQNVVSLIQPTSRHLGVTLSAELPDAEIEILGDAGVLEQALVNVILNGVEAAAADPTSSAASVQVSLRADDRHAWLTVADTGAGPAEAVRETLFEPFVTQKPDGVGLGLSVARETFRAHGGDITWRRCDEKTCFEIELPLTK